MNTFYRYIALTGRIFASCWILSLTRIGLAVLCIFEIISFPLDTLLQEVFPRLETLFLRTFSETCTESSTEAASRGRGG